MSVRSSTSSRSSTSRRLAALSCNTRGSMYMVLASLGYVTNDALIRRATEEGLDVYQALCLRGIAMSALFAAATGLRRVDLTRDRLSGPLVIRVVTEVLSSALFFAAITRLDFANAQTILLIVPFIVTIAAALILGEPVSRLRYVTVLAGFVGVLLVVQPTTEGFSFWSLAVVGSAVCLTVREFATRRIDVDVPSSFVAFVTSVAMTATAGALAVFTGWNQVTARAGLLVLVACGCLVVGYVFAIQTVRVGDLSVSAPFRYTALLGAVVLGYLFFSEVPDLWTVAGCAVIVLSGLFSIHLERRAARPVASAVGRVDGRV